jgi:hypothetical protein
MRSCNLIRRLKSANGQSLIFVLSVIRETHCDRSYAQRPEPKTNVCSDAIMQCDDGFNDTAGINQPGRSHSGIVSPDNCDSNSNRTLTSARRKAMRHRNNLACDYLF